MSKVSDTEGVVLLAGVGIAAYLAYKIYTTVKSGVTAAGAAISNAQDSAGSAIADLFPNNIAVPGGTYNVTMPDGSVQIVPYGALPVPSSQYVAPFVPSEADYSSAGNY